MMLCKINRYFSYLVCSFQKIIIFQKYLLQKIIQKLQLKNKQFFSQEKNPQNHPKNLQKLNNKFFSSLFLVIFGFSSDCNIKNKSYLLIEAGE